MKALLVTLLILGAAFLAYDYYAAAPGEKIVFKSLNTPLPAPKPEAPPAQAPAEAAKPVPPPVITAHPDAPAVPVKPATEAKPPAGNPTASPAAITVDPSGFVPPRFDTLEVLSKHWTKIPSIAFPRQVKLMKNVQFQMGAGVASKSAGTEVTALSFDNSVLTLAPSETSTARATAAIDDTNLKEVLQPGYEAWKIARTAEAKKAFLARLARGSAPAGPVDPNSVDAGGKPVRGNDGTFPILVASLKNGDVTEIKLANIHHWDDPQPTMVEGKPAWSIKVQCDVDTIFGAQPAEAQALVRDGRVKGWFYTGSGEAVP